ncbi:glutamate--tRNA ligase [Ureaplasma urealyticum]|uniref:glutamate--tRNA ligase n=1 Tax=Ureaplasma urealyticum TaxID=2130 RepID=UPI00307CCDFE
MKIRTRYAPSPTGYLHIGGARTALFNYLLAKAYDGDFIIRIEDTDVERNVEGGIDSQFNFLEWMGIVADESIRNPKTFGPYIQSQKLKHYEALALDLVAQKKAYFCFCSKERLDADRELAEKLHETPKYKRHCLNLNEQTIQANLLANKEYTIRLKIDENNEYSWDDLIRGKISIPGSALTDPVILKSNKIAMYNFAVVIDDYEMQISHVIRGEEHISNTPYQLAIAQALNYDLSKIKYGHLSIIVDETGKKLSKRNLALKQFVSDYEKDGYWPHAITNFVALLGWSPKNNQEIMSLVEMVENFDVNNLSKSPAFFDINKMNWFSTQYFNNISQDEFIDFVKTHPLTKELVLKDTTFIDKALLFKSHIVNLKQLINLVDEQFNSNKQLLEEDVNHIKNNQLTNVVQVFYEQLIVSEKFNEQSIKEVIKQVQKTTNNKGANLYMPIRIATTFSSHGPELAKTIYYLGRENVLKNLQSILKVLG